MNPNTDTTSAKSAPAATAKAITYILSGISCGIFCGGACLAFAWISSLCDVTFRENNWLLFFLPLTGVAVVLLYDYFRKEDALNIDAVFRYSHGESRKELETTDYVSPWLSPFIVISTCLAYLTGGSLGRVGSALQVGGGLGALLHKFYSQKINSGRNRAASLPKATLNNSTDTPCSHYRNLFLACGMGAGFTAMLDVPVAGAIFGVEVLILSGSDLFIIIPALISSFITWFMAGLFNISYIDLHISPEASFDAVFKGVPDNTLFLKVLVVAFATTLLGRLYAYSRIGVAKAFSFIPNKIVRVLVGTGLVIAITLILGHTWYNGIGFVYVRQILDGEGSQFAFILKLLLTAITLGCGIRGGDISPSIFIGATGGFTLGCSLGLDPGTAAAIGIVGTLGSVTKCPVASFVAGLEMLCCSTSSAICFAITSIFVHIFSGTYGIYRQQHSENQILKPRIR